MGNNEIEGRRLSGTLLTTLGSIGVYSVVCPEHHAKGVMLHNMNFSTGVVLYECGCAGEVESGPISPPPKIIASPHH